MFWAMETLVLATAYLWVNCMREEWSHGFEIAGQSVTAVEGNIPNTPGLQGHYSEGAKYSATPVRHFCTSGLKAL